MLGAVLLVAGCGHPAGSAGPVTTASSVSQPADCPVPTTPAHFPGDVPSNLPAPPGIHLISDTTDPQGLQFVRFSTPTSLREGILFVLSAFPKAGFVLARGDAEVSEADAPFASQDGIIRGALRLVVLGQCDTTWLLAVARAAFGKVAAVPTFRPTSTTSPLPFG